MRQNRTRSAAKAGFAGFALIATGCATMSTPGMEPYVSSGMVSSDGETPDIVVADVSQTIGTSWSSITESPLARTATELSNLGGAPVVAGAVGIILAADAGSKRRASRLSDAMNAEADTTNYSEALLAEIEQAAADDMDADIALVRRVEAIPRESYLIQTDYVLAEDGSALRVTASVFHEADIRRRAEMQRIVEQLEREQFRSSGTSYRSVSSARLSRRLRALASVAPRYRGTFEYHSRPLDLPDVGTPSGPDLETDLIEALQLERDAREAEARKVYEQAAFKVVSDRKRRKADRKLAKALEKAEKRHAESVEKARDGKIDKMERLLLALSAWNTGAEATQLDQAVENAHAFFADAVADRLGLDGASVEPAADDRMIMEIGTISQGDKLISLPRNGMADYGGGVARP